MVVAEGLRALRMAEDGDVDADLPDCDCDVTRQASPRVPSVVRSSRVPWAWQVGAPLRPRGGCQGEVERIGLGNCWLGTPKSYLGAGVLIILLGRWSWMRRVMSLAMAWDPSCLRTICVIRGYGYSREPETQEKI